MAGLVYSGTERISPGTKIELEQPLMIKQSGTPFVSRGGLKLAKALEQFCISLSGKIVLDIGASTGGFTDCALQNGAKTVYAVDVGYNQLAWKLRQDKRVVVMERTNFRYVTPNQLTKGLPEFVTIDVSFISLTRILPVLTSILPKQGQVIALVKPQFEAERNQIGNKGVISDPEVHRQVVSKISAYAIKEGFSIAGIDFSPIKGGEGNIEFLLFLERTTNKPHSNLEQNIAAVIKEAHQHFDTKK